MTLLKVGDKIINITRDLNNEGVVWKVTDEAIHVRYSDGYFEKFFFNPIHHSQSSIDDIKIQ